jgi:hypothetical protein
MTRAERILFWLAIANFLSFVIIAGALGGDALNGAQRDGRYFLMMHGVYREVSRGVFLYSEAHIVSLFLTQPLGIIAAVRARRRARGTE